MTTHHDDSKHLAGYRVIGLEGRFGWSAYVYEAERTGQADWAGYATADTEAEAIEHAMKAAGIK